MIIAYKMEELDKLERRLAALPRNIKSARIYAMTQYIKKLLPSHFSLYNPNGRYKPNTIQYEIQKAEKYGRLPQLVVSGYLRKQVLAGTVTTTGKLRFNLPKYGIYQIEAGRNFLKLDAVEKKLIAKYMGQELRAIRKKLPK